MSFVKEIKIISKSISVLKFGALPYGENEIMESVADVSQIEKLGWNAKYSYKEGLKNIINAE